MSVNSLNKFVVSFFKENGDADNLEQVWMAAANQKVLKKVLSKSDVTVVKKKDPNAPKRAKSTYMFFCDAHRSLLKEKLGADAKTTDITRQLGAQWNALKASAEKNDKKALAEMKKYEKQAEEDKVRYQDEKKDYVPSFEYQEVSAKGKRGKKSGPKRAKSSYMFFCEENREVVKKKLGDDAKVTDITRELGSMWNELKADTSRSSEMKKYVDKAEADKRRYLGEKETYVESEDEPVSKGKGKATKAKGAVKGKGKATKAKASGKGNASKMADIDDVEEETTTKKSTKKSSKKSSKKSTDSAKKPSSGYHLFCDENRAQVKSDNPEMSARDVTSELSKMWKALGADGQQEYKERV